MRDGGREEGREKGGGEKRKEKEEREVERRIVNEDVLFTLQSFLLKFMKIRILFPKALFSCPP